MGYGLVTNIVAERVWGSRVGITSFTCNLVTKWRFCCQWNMHKMLRASCLKLETNEFGCNEASHDRWTTTNPHNPLYVLDCEGWWLSSCCGSVGDHWQLKPEVSCVRLPAAASLSHFPFYFHLITSRFIYAQNGAASTTV